MENSLESDFKGHQYDCTSFCLCRHSVCFFLIFFEKLNERVLVGCKRFGLGT